MNNILVLNDSTKERHEDLMFDPNLHIRVEERNQRDRFTQDIHVGGKHQHRLVVTSKGAEYFEVQHDK